MAERSKALELGLCSFYPVIRGEGSNPSVVILTYFLCQSKDNLNLQLYTITSASALGSLHHIARPRLERVFTREDLPDALAELIDTVFSLFRAQLLPLLSVPPSAVALVINAPAASLSAAVTPHRK